MNQLQAYNLGEDGDEVKYASSVLGNWNCQGVKVSKIYSISMQY
jgi:hypothetical protein